MVWLLAIAAAAPPKAELHGDVKAFFLAGFPRQWFGFSEDSVAVLDAMGLSEEEALDYYGLSADPYGQGIASGRLKGAATVGPLRFDVHYALALQTGGESTTFFSTGVGLTAPEIVPLSWSPDTGEALIIRHRIDRLVLSAKLPQVDVALGRQPLSFGSGRFFTPLDLVNPFHPATIDTEYKPGVDALRVDVYAGTATHLTAVAAWAGQPVVGDNARDPERPILDDLVLALTGQATVGVTDVLGFAGSVHAEPVFGLGAVSSIGPVGVHAEASLTLPDGDDPFVRAVIGADGRPTDTTMLTGEAYLQTFGATDPGDYLAALDSPRFERGELWQMGQLYAALAVSQELTPLLHVNGSVIANMRDPSALIAVGGSWSVSDNADVVLGGYFGLGEAPDVVELDLTVEQPTISEDALADSVNSEFGLYPALAYLQVRTYF